MNLKTPLFVHQYDDLNLSGVDSGFVVN